MDSSRDVLDRRISGANGRLSGVGCPFFLWAFDH
jgi:hypothetical protein